MTMSDGEKSNATLAAELEEARAENAELKRSVAEHVNARSQAEEALVMSEERYQVLAEDLRVGVVVHGPSAEILLSNPRALELLGLTRDQLLGKTSFDPSWNVVHEDGSPFPGPTHPSVQALATHQPVRDVVMGVARPGAERRVWLLVNADPKLTWDGRVRQVVVTFTDITERKRAEEDRAHLAAMVIDSDDAIISKGLDGTIQSWNLGAEKLFGYTAAEAIGRPTDILLPPGRQNEEAEILQRLQRGERIAHFETVRWTKGEQPIDVSVAVSPQRRGDGHVFGACEVVRDITERKRADEALRESEARFRSYFNLPLHGITVTSPEKGWLEVNDQVCAILGYSREEFARLTWAELTHPDDLAADVAQFERLLAGQIDQYTLDKRFLRKDGTTVWTTISVGCVRGPGGEVRYFVCAMSDVSDRKRAEEGLRELTQRLYLATASARAGVWDWNLQTHEMVWDDRMRELYGLDRESFPGGIEAWERGLHPEDRSRATEECQAALRGEREFDTEFRVRRPDGGVSYIKANGLVLRDEDGKPLRMIGLNVDITERKRAEEVAGDNERIRRLAFQIGRIGAFEVDIESGRGHWTPELAAMWGIPAAFEGDFAAYCWAHTHPDDLLRVAEAFERGKMSRQVFEMDFRVLRPGGDVQWIRWLGQVVQLVDGGPLTAVGVNQDVSERKRAEAEKARLEGQLHQAQKMESVGRLAGGVAHDFNNMLGVILGHVSLALEDMDPTQPVLEDLLEIQKAAQRSAALTRQLLAYARKQVQMPKVLDLNETMAGMLTMLRRTLGENINLLWRPGAELWPVKVDPSQLDQILTNLCVNARDAIADVGKLTIETGNSTFDDEFCAAHEGAVLGEYVRLVVSDDGCGINEETRAHLFEPFFTTKEMGKGTGLGLATVYGIVKQNGGFIDVCSESEHGTTFTVYLPRHGAEVDSEGAPTVLPAVRGHETILLVEDEPGILRTTKRMLERLGYKVLAALSPAEAMRLARENGDIHLLLSDVVMPEMNGRDLAKKLLALYPNLARVFMSGYTADVIARHGVLEDGVNFIQKPFPKDELAAKIRAALDGGPAN